IRNLELLPTSERPESLLKVLDNTVSPMGARLMKRWMLMPLTDLARINERLDLTEFLIVQTDLRNNLSQQIKQCGDIERLVSKVPLKKINPREVLQIAKGLQLVAKIKTEISTAPNEYLKRLGD